MWWRLNAPRPDVALSARLAVAEAVVRHLTAEVGVGVYRSPGMDGPWSPVSAEEVPARLVQHSCWVPTPGVELLWLAAPQDWSPRWLKGLGG